MCGLSGIINFQKKPNSSITRKMLDSIDHRGPDQKIIANNNFSSIGFVRLSIGLENVDDIKADIDQALG